MKCTAERLSLIIRTLLLVICCTLFLPQGLQASQHKGMDSSVIRASAMTLAITAINNPTSHLQNLANGENTALRGPGQRTGFSSPGKRPLVSNPGKRHSHDGYTADADGDSSAVLPGLPPLPSSFSLCTKESFSFCALPPESHGHIHWFALAPPALRNV